MTAVKRNESYLAKKEKRKEGMNPTVNLIRIY